MSEVEAAERPDTRSENLGVVVAKAAKADGAGLPFVEAGLAKTDGKGFEVGVGAVKVKDEVGGVKAKRGDLAAGGSSSCDEERVRQADFTA